MKTGPDKKWLLNSCCVYLQIHEKGTCDGLVHRHKPEKVFKGCCSLSRCVHVALNSFLCTFITCEWVGVQLPVARVLFKEVDTTGAQRDGGKREKVCSVHILWWYPSLSFPTSPPAFPPCLSISSLPPSPPSPLPPAFLLIHLFLYQGKSVPVLCLEGFHQLLQTVNIRYPNKMDTFLTSVNPTIEEDTGKNERVHFFVRHFQVH